jgi:hypothetical protein
VKAVQDFASLAINSLPINAEKPFKVISKDMQAHFRVDPVKGLCQELRGTHPRIEGAKWMIHSLPSILSRMPFAQHGIIRLARVLEGQSK